MCKKKFSKSWLSSLPVFFLAALAFGASPLQAQEIAPSTPNAQDSRSLQMNNPLPFDKALRLARQMLTDSLASFDKAKEEASAWRLDSLKWQAEATALSQELTQEREASEAQSRSLTDLSKRAEDADKARLAERAKDKTAVDSARAERDVWRFGGATSICVAVVVAVWGLTR